jgi:hypothetical protein
MKPQRVDRWTSYVGPTYDSAEDQSATDRLDLIEQRASRADVDRYRAILAKVPDVPPQPGDALPPE